jgi:hypothetical protein
VSELCRSRRSLTTFFCRAPLSEVTSAASKFEPGSVVVEGPNRQAESGKMGPLPLQDSLLPKTLGFSWLDLEDLAVRIAIDSTGFPALAEPLGKASRMTAFRLQSRGP